MSLACRVRKLEGRSGVPGARPCSCRDALPACTVWYEDTPRPEVREETCTLCGGARESLLVLVEYDDPPPGCTDDRRPGEEEP